MSGGEPWRRRVAVAPEVLEFATDDPIAARALEALYHAAPASADAPTLRYALRRAVPGAGAGGGEEAAPDRASGGWMATCPARPPFGPVSLEDGWAFLEWRATEDLLGAAALAPEGSVFLHAGGVVIGSRLALVIGASGAGKTTLVAHLLLRGHRMLGDDLVRFTPRDGSFSAVGRSLKLDDNSLRSMPFIASRCAGGGVGTLLAAGCSYVSPAAIRRDWAAAPARPWAVVLLDPQRRGDASGIVPTSEGEAAIVVTQSVLGGSTQAGGGVRAGTAARLLEALADTVAWRAVGTDPAAVAAALEREAA